jgi:hypothetical protein
MCSHQRSWGYLWRILWSLWCECLLSPKSSTETYSLMWWSRRRDLLGGSWAMRAGLSWG